MMIESVCCVCITVQLLGTDRERLDRFDRPRPVTFQKRRFELGSPSFHLTTERREVNPKEAQLKLGKAFARNPSSRAPNLTLDAAPMACRA